MTDGATTWSYTYDANGMRTSRTNSTTTYNYVYNGSQLVQMTVGSNTLNFAYDASGMPMTVTYNGTNYYYITNLQGDVMGIVDSTGTIVVNYTYDAWGKPLSITGTMADTLGTLNLLRYRGYVYDTETGYYYLQSRYYNSIIGRFINGDGLITTGQGLIGHNMFAYCLNNPVLMYDSNGLRAVINNRCFGGVSNPNITSDGQGRSDILLALCVAKTAQISQNKDFRLSVQNLGRQFKQTDQSLNQAKNLLTLGIGSLLGKYIPTIASIIETAADVGGIIKMGNNTMKFPDGYYDTYKISLSWKTTYELWEDRTVHEYCSYEFIVCWDTVSAAMPQWQIADSSQNIQTSVVFH